MSKDLIDRRVKIPTFDGEMTDFPSWWKKFSAQATMTKTKDNLSKERDPILPEKDVSALEKEDDSNKFIRIAIRKNELAMSSFSIAFTTE